MANHQVTKLPSPVLKKKSSKVTRFDSDFQQLVDDMIETMRNEPGVGLAAPQINVPLRLIVVEYPENDQDVNASPKLFVLANPEFTEMSEEKVGGVEGCLSVPNILGEVSRSVQVTVRGLNRHGKKQTIKARGWLARIFQHEVDHINGILFIDRAEKLYHPDEVQKDQVV